MSSLSTNAGRAIFSQHTNGSKKDQDPWNEQNPKLHSWLWHGLSHVCVRPRNRSPHLHSTTDPRSQSGRHRHALHLHLSPNSDPFSSCPWWYFNHPISTSLSLSIILSGTASPLLTRLITDLKIGKSDIGKFVVSTGVQSDLVSTLLLALGFIVFDPMNGYKVRTLREIIGIVGNLSLKIYYLLF